MSDGGSPAVSSRLAGCDDAGHGTARRMQGEEGREGWREGGREGGMEGWREGGRDGGKVGDDMKDQLT